MDKSYLPYLHNGKTFQTLPTGQYLYYYPKGDGVEIVKVSKELRRELFEFDKREYNDDHREYRRRGELPTYDDTDAWEYVADENTYTLEDSICERMDRENILKGYPDEYSAIVKMAHEKFTQSEIAQAIGKTQGYVSQILAKISNVFEEDNINDGERTEAEQYAEKLWREFVRTGKCEQYYDVFMDYLTAQLHKEDIYFCLDWFYTEREFIRNIFYALIVGYDTQTEDIEHYHLSTTPQRWEKFQSRYGHLTLTAQGAFSILFMEAERRQRIYKTVKRKFLTRFQKEAIRQAKRKNINVDDALLPSQEKYHQERLKRLQKYRREKVENIFENY